MVLVGLSGAGKSTAGKAAAQKVGMRFVDLDAEIVKRAGKSITEIFDSLGEHAFRDMETAATEMALVGDPAVIASGAGWIAYARNRALLRSLGRIIYLRVDAPTAAGRLGENHGRPMLAEGATIDRLRLLEVQRAAFYELADAAIDTQTLTEQQVTDKLSDLIRVLREEKQ